MKNVLVGQSGGPTAVINSSLAGVYEHREGLRCTPCLRYAVRH